jgi:hypothetical protein
MTILILYNKIKQRLFNLQIKIAGRQDHTLWQALVLALACVSLYFIFRLQTINH